MDDLQAWQYLAIGLIFVWTGFVRSGLGFGGAALGLPLLLLVIDDALIWLPLIGMHLLFFSSITVGSRMGHVDWIYLRKAMLIMIAPMLIGVFGLLTLPSSWVTAFVYLTTLFYACCYLFKFQIYSSKAWVDYVLLSGGAYAAGVSLIGAPLIVAVFVHHVAKDQLRNTLFVLWFALVVIKLSVLWSVGVNFWWSQHLWLLPCAALGHVIGLRLHDHLMAGDAARFKQLIGAVLVVICGFGLLGS
ncbi:MAG: TSUP family transporter [Mariprofundus sp.]|nr:TSUP family transporter [Mariprofundus sp.]